MFRAVLRTFVLSSLLTLTLAGCDKFSLLSEFSQSQTGSSGSSGSSVLAISPAAPAILVGTTVNFRGSGGSGQYSFSLSSGGGAVDPISGVYTAPATAGSATVTLTDALKGDTVQAVVSIVAASQLRINPASLTIGASGSYQFGASGGATPYTYSVYGGTVAGESIDSATGAYHAPSSTSVRYVRVTDNVGTTSDATVTVVASGALTISPTTVKIPENTSFTFAASGGTPGYTFSVVPGGTGTINSATGVYNAIGAVGPSVATIQLKDSTGAVAATSARVDIIPAAPSNVGISAAVSGITLTWQNNTSGADNVVVERKTGSTGAWGTLATLVPATTTYFDSVSPDKTLYVYRVYAVKGTLQSKYSQEVFAVASP